MLSNGFVWLISVILGIFAVSEGNSIKYFRPVTKIFNGLDVTLNEIRFQVSIQYAGIHYHFCSGSIINNYFVLSAAHCFEGRTVDSVKIVAGTTNLLNEVSTHDVTSIYVPDGYNPNDSYVHDIALVKVDPPFIYSVNLYPIPLPNPNVPIYAGDVAVVSGWGLTHNDEYPNMMQKTEIYITDDEYCYDLYKKVNYTTYSSQICANEENVGRGVHFGDSGGPLTVDNVLVGIASWAYNYTTRDYPTIFTRVSYYIDWILDHIEENNI